MITDTSLPGNILTTDRYEAQQRSISSADQEMGRDAFLRLFTTQLQNQDPLSPMDNEAFVAQLAQFSSLESMKGMQQSVEDMANELRTDRFYSGANLLGRTVSVSGGPVPGGEGREIAGSATIPGGVDGVSFTVHDRTGAIVYSHEYGPVPAGEMQFEWTGNDNEGNPVTPGDYRLAIAVEKNGAYLQLPVMNREQITSVRWDAELQELLLETEGGQMLKLSELNRVNL